LFALVFEICGAVSFLGEVDMKAFRLFSIIVIRGAKKCDRSGVMEEAMEFGKVEVFPDSKVNKNTLVLVKSAQSSIHCSETFCGVHWILRKVDKIKECPHNTGQACGRLNTYNS
jgi:hypothetical protein